MSHGSKNHREPGSTGAGTTPGRIYPGKRMAGRYGGKKITTKGLTIIKVDDSKNLLVVKGSVPGKPGSLLNICPAKTVDSKVNKGGKNIYPEEIEEFFSSSIYIEDIVVFSNNDKDIIALIYPEEELIKTKNIEEIRKIIYKEGIEINKKLESYKRVNKFYITLDVFEKTSTQKIKRTF